MKMDFVDEVVGCDKDEAQRAKIEKLGLRFFPSVDAMLEEGVDAALVVTAPALHAGIIRQCLEARVPVLTEKPLSTDVAEGRRLVALAEKKGLAFQVGFELRYCGYVKGMREILAGGLIGEARHMSLVQISGPKSDPTYMRRARVGGIFFEKLCHEIDLYRYFLGEPERVMAASSPSVLEHYDVPDNVISRLDFPGGRAGNIFFITTRAAQTGGTDDHGDRGHFFELILTGTKGSVTFDAWTNSLEIVRFNHRDDLQNELVESIRNIRERWGIETYNVDDQDADFLRRVKEGRPPQFPASDAQVTMEWVRRAEMSLERGGEWIGREE
jgi:predicted dehydrogenase